MGGVDAGDVSVVRHGEAPDNTVCGYVSFPVEAFVVTDVTEDNFCFDIEESTIHAVKCIPDTLHFRP